jgi:protein-tyrosine phosphatase
MPEAFRVANIGNGHLAVMARPGVGEPIPKTFATLATLGVRVVVSLLEATETRELGLEGEHSACEAAGIEFFSFPIKDRGLPRDPEAVSRLSRLAHARIAEGCGWVFHCRAGIGRSGMMAASVLLQDGLTVREAFARISAARGLTVPDTPGQLEWLEEHSAIIAGKISAPDGPVSE